MEGCKGEDTVRVDGEGEALAIPDVGMISIAVKVTKDSGVEARERVAQVVAVSTGIRHTSKVEGESACESGPSFFSLLFFARLLMSVWVCAWLRSGDLPLLATLDVHTGTAAADEGDGSQRRRFPNGAVQPSAGV